MILTAVVIAIPDCADIESRMKRPKCWPHQERRKVSSSAASTLAFIFPASWAPRMSMKRAFLQAMEQMMAELEALRFS